MDEGGGDVEGLTLDGRRSRSGHLEGAPRAQRGQQEVEGAGGAGRRGRGTTERTAPRQRGGRRQRARQETARAVCILSVLAKKEKKKKKSGMGAVGGFI
jgi:hypothetical protein